MQLACHSKNTVEALWEPGRGGVDAGEENPQPRLSALTR
jgi:hypothetical protein